MIIFVASIFLIEFKWVITKNYKDPIGTRSIAFEDLRENALLSGSEIHLTFQRSIHFQNKKYAWRRLTIFFT